MTFHEILSRLFEAWARLGCGLAGVPYDPEQHKDDKQDLS